jgi:steroid 5-alpha reductase family enzyme
MISAALWGLAACVAIAVVTWLVSLRQRDVSLVDRVWSVCILAAALAYAAVWPTLPARSVCMLVLGLAWAARLSIYITARNWGHGEERRYQAIRQRNEPGFAFKSLYLVFGLQALLSWVVSAPFLAGLMGDAPFGVLDIAGAGLAAFGIVWEAIADDQMSRFKRVPSNKDQVMDQGLWRYSRHPNYFGEACTWWGLWIMAMAASGWPALWSVVSPLLMTVLLLKVSGVSLLEKDIGERRPAYRHYIEHTNAFLPGRPH